MTFVNFMSRNANSSLLYGFYFYFWLVMSEVHLATLNVNGARDVRKRAMIFEVIKQKHIDVAFLQETQ